MDATGIPTSLKREIAQDANRQYFVEGAFTIEHGEYVVTTTIWETQTLDQVATISQRGWNLYDTIDRLSREVRKELEVPSSRIASDMPLAETYGESQSAFQNYIAGLNERLFNNDFAASNALFDAALEEDHNFVLAHFVKAISLIEGGDLPSAQVSLNKALQLDYRLPDRDRVILKANNYRLSGETDKLIEFLRMQVKLSDDAASHSRLGNILFVTGALEEAKREFKMRCSAIHLTWASTSYFPGWSARPATWMPPSPMRANTRRSVRRISRRTFKWETCSETRENWTRPKDTTSRRSCWKTTRFNRR